MLRFVIGSGRDRENPWIRYAAFELGVRLNVQFAIQNPSQELNPEDILLLYGEDSVPPAAHRRSLRIPCARADQACKAECIEGNWCYGSPAGRGLDVVAGAGELLSFVCEAGTTRDALGRIPPENHPLKATFSEPLIENNAAYLKAHIEKTFGELNPVSFPFGQGKGACVMTHDVDGPQLHTLFALSRSCLRGVLGHRDELGSLALGLSTLALRKPDPYWNFDKWADLEKSLGGKSTFFVYPGPTASAPRQAKDPHYHPARTPFPAALKSLAARGWEIGVHHGIAAHRASAYSESRQALREIVGDEAAGCRTHYWTGVWHDPYHAWNAMDNAGFRYDASLSPMTLGYRGGHMLPTMPSMRWRPRVSGGFVVLPTALMDSYANPRISSLEAGEIRSRLDRLTANARRNGLLVADWHVRTFVNSGAHSGQLTAFLAIVPALAAESGIVLMTANQAAESWRQHCARCYVEAQ